MPRSRATSETPTAYPYTKNKTLFLTTENNQVIQATITRAYKLTTTPVMEVEVGPSKQKRILKLYDRRFGSTREGNLFLSKKMPHTQASENAWRDYVCQGKAKDLFRSTRRFLDAVRYGSPLTVGDPGGSSDCSGECEPISGYDEMAEEEGTFQCQARALYETELEAYLRLEKAGFEGKYVPRHYESRLQNRT